MVCQFGLIWHTISHSIYRGIWDLTFDVEKNLLTLVSRELATSNISDKSLKIPWVSGSSYNSVILKKSQIHDDNNQFKEVNESNYYGVSCPHKVSSNAIWNWEGWKIVILEPVLY